MNDASFGLFLPGISEGSSEDEPLINLVKKRKAQPKVKTPQKKTKSPKMLEEKHVSGKDSNVLSFSKSKRNQ